MNHQEVTRKEKARKHRLEHIQLINPWRTQLHPPHCQEKEKYHISHYRYEMKERHW